MKKRNVIYLILIAVCLVSFVGYRYYDRITTDTKAPEITVSADVLQVSVQDPDSALLAGVTATDDRDGDVSASVVVEDMRLTDPAGNIVVKYAAFDKAGNVAKTERAAKLTDYASPRFSLASPLVFTQNSSFDVLSVITASDTLDGDITHRIRATSLGEKSISSVGTHSVEFRVTNSLGETVELVLPVEVRTPETYDSTLKLTNYIVYLPVGSYFDPNAYLDTYTVGAGTVSLKEGLPANYYLETTGTVDTATPGVYSVSYNMNYVSVNQANANFNRYYNGYSKLIVVVEG